MDKKIILLSISAITLFMSIFVDSTNATGWSCNFSNIANNSVFTCFITSTWEVVSQYDLTPNASYNWVTASVAPASITLHQVKTSTGYFLVFNNRQAITFSWTIHWIDNNTIIGPQWATGATWPQGIQWIAWNTGATGPTGPQWATGATWQSAYQLAQTNWFTWSAFQWLASLIWPTWATWATWASIVDFTQSWTIQVQSIVNSVDSWSLDWNSVYLPLTVKNNWITYVDWFTLRNIFLFFIIIIMFWIIIKKTLSWKNSL